MCAKLDGGLQHSRHLNMTSFHIEARKQEYTNTPYAVGHNECALAIYEDSTCR